MKNIIAILLVLFDCSIVRSQAQQGWQWVISGEGCTTTNMSGLIVSGSGNIYVSGGFRCPSVVFGGSTMTSGIQNFGSSAASSGFLMKLNNGGEALWHQNRDYVGYSCQILDEDENLYVIGSFYDSITFGNTTLHAPTAWGAGFFIAKFNSSGNLIWAGRTAEFNQISKDASGNLYGCGWFTVPTVSIGNFSVARRPDVNCDYYIVKHDASGNVKWAKSGGGIHDIASNVCVGADAAGNSYVAGSYFNDTSIADGFSTLFDDTTDTDFFIAKYDALGNLLWRKTAGATGVKGDYLNDLVIAPNGTIYVTGSFSGSSMRFGGATLYGNALCANFFIICMDSSAQVIWATGNQNIYNNRGEHLAVDAGSNVYLAGTFNNTLDIDTNYTFTSKGQADIFIAKYDAFGNILFATSLGSSTADMPTGISADSYGNAYISGLAYDTIELNEDLNIGSIGMYVAKISTPQGTTAVEPVRVEQISVYPNPFSEEVKIQNKAGGLFQFVLYDYLGKQIITSELSGESNAIGLSECVGDIYFYKITSGSHIVKSGKLLHLK